MKLPLLSIVLLSAISTVASASAPNDSKPTPQEQRDSCVKQCGNPRCDYIYGVKQDLVCVAKYKDCLAKCRIDYELEKMKHPAPIRKSEK